jgi:choline transport protein
LFSLSITVIIALINLASSGQASEMCVSADALQGSTAALNTIFALLTGATSFSYAVSITCVLVKRLSGAQLPPARFSLGNLAVPVNIFAVAYVVTAAVASFFPVAVPVDAASMNWYQLIRVHSIMES